MEPKELEHVAGMPIVHRLVRDIAKLERCVIVSTSNSLPISIISENHFGLITVDGKAK